MHDTPYLACPPRRPGGATPGWALPAPDPPPAIAVPPAPGRAPFAHAHRDVDAVATGGPLAPPGRERSGDAAATSADGAEGEIHDPTLDPAEARPRLSAIRPAELACSLDALGGGAIRQHLLGYRDSGMIGTDANSHPDSFWQADLADATRQLVDIIREA